MVIYFQKTDKRKKASQNTAFGSEDIFSMFNSVTGKYHCLRCDKTYDTKGGLQQDYQVHVGKFSYWCDQCFKGFTGKSHYDAHMAKHAGITFPCAVCNKTFQSKRGMQIHHKQHHHK